MLDIQSRAYRKQYGCNFVNLIPNNTYGLNDNYHLTRGHVIPSIIRKVYEAKKAGGLFVHLWGDGNVARQFTFAEDMADVIWWAVENYDHDSPLNVGNPREYGLKEVVQTIVKCLDYNGEIVWDKSQPVGQIRKTMSTGKLNLTTYRQRWTSLEDGIKKTCQYFVNNYPNLRGIE